MIEKGRIPSLDGFRAVSITIVIFAHLANHNLLPSPLQDLFSEVFFGELGVRIFFIISGFLITYLLLKEKSKNGSVNLKAFYIRRILRIFPVFYVYLVIIALLNNSFDLKVPSMQFLSSALYIQNFAPWGGVWLIGHTWSLAVEEQFYLLWPALFIQINQIKRFRIWISVILMASFFRTLNYKFPDLAQYFLAPFFMHADFLFSGCFIAFFAFYRNEEIMRFVNRVPPLLIYLSIILLWFFSKFEMHPVYDKFFVPTAGAVVNVCVSFLIVYFVFKPGTPGFRILNHPVLGFVGKLSYSLYVWQQLFTVQYSVWWLKFPFNLVWTFLAAYLSYVVVEKPFLRLKDRFAKVTNKNLAEGVTG